MMKQFFKKQLFVIAIMMLFSVATFAQGTLKGIVSDAQGAGIPGSSVAILGTRMGAATGADGSYSFNLPNGTYEVRFSSVGYNSISKAVTVNGETVANAMLETSATSLDEVVVSVGSRNSQRTITDTPLPIDIIGATDLKSTGQMTFDKALQYRVPSFNTVNTPVNDATSLLDPYEIRNMGPSRTLVLINGKRKNSSALVYIQTSPGRGESGADISAIPTDAIKRVEILRDGASAQYGSDAIAGVMNIILKDKFEYGSVTFNTGITHKGDGKMVGLTVNNGANFGTKGYINYTMSLSNQGQSNRPGIVSAAAEADANLGFDAPLADVQAFLKLKPDAGNINGAPETTAAKFLVNGGIPAGANSELYFNAAYVYKKVNSFANYRTPYWRTTDDGLLHAAGTPYLGYVPTFEGDLNDYNGTLGFKSEKNGWKSDVSITTGGNTQLYTVGNSRNRGLGKNSPILFKPGGYSFDHNVFNIDLSKPLSEKVNLSFGSEFRSENFEIMAGDTASYATAPGSDSFPGIAASNAKKSNRYNFGGYVGLGFDISKDFLIDLTARSEKYSDFGNAFVWKASTRYKFAEDKVTLRASISTGFRAPSLHQINLQLSQASFVPGQGIQNKGIFNNNSSQARLLGVPKLKAEESTNFTVGLGIKPTKNFSATLDYFNIVVNNRIILGSEISGDIKNPKTDLDKILASNGIVAISFFTNGLNTRTSGLDFVSSYRNIMVGSNKMTLNLAGNYMLDNKVLKVLNPALISAAGKSIFDRTQEKLLLTSRPKFKAILGADLQMKKVLISLNNTLFGPTTFHQNGIDANLDTEFATKLVTDLGASIQLGKNTNLGLNINNLFNVMPKWNYKALNASGETVLKDAKQVSDITNLITFNGRYSNVTYDGSHFSQLGTLFSAALTVKF
jgi:iron complex outermembrane recepter protein